MHEVTSATRASRWLAALGAGLCLATPALARSPQTGDVLWIQAEKVVVRPGEELADAAVLVEDGRIVAVGPDVQAPEGARQLTGKVVCAGFIDPWTGFGLDARSLRDERTSAASRSVDALDPYVDPRLVEDMLRGGVTALRVQAGATAKVGGLGALVRCLPDADDLVVSEEACMAMSVGLDRNDRMLDVFDRVAEVDAVAAALGSGKSYREDQLEYRDELAEWQKAIAEKEEELEDDFKKAKKDREKEIEKAEEKGKEHKEKRYKEDKKPSAPKFDADKEALARVANGELPLIVEVHRANEIRELLASLEEYTRVRLILAGATEALPFAEELAERDVPVIVWPAPRGKARPDAYEQADPALAGKLHAAGVEVLLGSGGQAGIASRDLSLLAALAVGHGLEAEAAFEALTVGAARALDVSDRLGTVERGKSADLLVLDGDPLTLDGRVRHAVCGGEVVYTAEGN